MTKRTKDAHISDSASGGKGESMAREIRLKELRRLAEGAPEGQPVAMSKHGFLALLSECKGLASRVEKLEEALKWSADSLRGCLPLVQGNGYRDASDKIKHGLEVCERVLAGKKE